MAKTIKNMFGGGDGKARRAQAARDASDQAARLAEQSRQLNERNTQIASETRTSRSKRGRRLLAYKGQETGLRATLGA